MGNTTLLSATEIIKWPLLFELIYWIGQPIFLQYVIKELNLDQKSYWIIGFL